MQKQLQYEHVLVKDVRKVLYVSKRVIVTLAVLLIGQVEQEKWNLWIGFKISELYHFIQGAILWSFDSSIFRNMQIKCCKHSSFAQYKKTIIICYQFTLLFYPISLYTPLCFQFYPLRNFRKLGKLTCCCTTHVVFLSVNLLLSST